MGTATPLTGIDDTTYQVKVSSDGKVIAFTRETGLWAILSDGTNERLLISSNDIRALEPTDPGVSLSQLGWIPNTHKMLFNTRLNTGYGIAKTDDLYLLNADNQERLTLLPPGGGGNFYISPDGKMVAIVTPDEIRMMGVDGSNYYTALVYPTVSVPSEYAYYAQPVWAADSKSLLVAIPPRDVFYHETASPITIWHILTDGQLATAIAHISPELGQYVYISPDLSKTALINYAMSGDTDLHLAKMDGTNSEDYTNCNRPFFIWAPDSQHFICQSDHGFLFGGSGSDMVYLSDKGDGFTWVNAENYLYSYGYSGSTEIRLGFINEPSITLVGPETGPIYYDISK